MMNLGRDLNQSFGERSFAALPLRATRFPSARALERTARELLWRERELVDFTQLLSFGSLTAITLALGDGVMIASIRERTDWWLSDEMDEVPAPKRTPDDAMYFGVHVVCPTWQSTSARFLESL